MFTHELLSWKVKSKWVGETNNIKAWVDLSTFLPSAIAPKNKSTTCLGSLFSSF